MIAKVLKVYNELDTEKKVAVWILGIIGLFLFAGYLSLWFWAPGIAMWLTLTALVMTVIIAGGISLMILFDEY